MIRIISTYNKNNTYSKNCLFVLSKGNNAGKVLDLPCPNCFVIFCYSEKDKLLYKNFIETLFNNQIFKPYLTGSVISFITIHNFKKVLMDNEYIMINDNFSYLTNKIEDLNNLRQQFLKNITLIQDAKKLIYYRIFKK